MHAAPVGAILWRRRPAAAAWLVAVAVGVNLLPDLVNTPASGHTWLGEYVTRYLLPMTHRDQYLGTWASDLVYNQSLAGAGQRWLVTTWEWAATDCIVFRRPVPHRPRCADRLARLRTALVLLTLAVCRRPFQKLANDRLHPSRRTALEYSVVLLLMLLLSPMSSKAHFGVLILPGFCLARAAFSDNRRWLYPILIGAICWRCFNKSPLGERLYTLSLWLGCVTWETLFLLIGCLGLLAVGDNAVSQKMPAPVPRDPRAA